MRKISLLFSTISLIVFSTAYRDVEESPSAKVSSYYSEKMQAMINSLTEFKGSLKEGNEERIDRSYKQCRVEYKKLEFLLFYLLPNEIEASINAAPLYKLAIDTDLPKLLKPTGLQVIDELIPEKADVEVRNQLIEETDFLINKFASIAKFSASHTIDDRQVFEAMRREITVISTLGLSGFDTPGTAMSLTDIEVSLSALKWCFGLYRKELEKEGFNRINETNGLFDKGLELLQDQKFDDFDRFTFTSDILNVLALRLLDAQKVLNIEFMDEVTDLPMAVNIRSANLYSVDFLNSEFFTRASLKSKNSEKLQSLGKRLFFDPILSANNERACASCHSPKLAFSENRAKSASFSNKGSLNRNAMTLANSSYAEKFFYDLRAGNLFMQFEHVFLNDDEFNTTFFEVEKKLNTCEEYISLFSEVFELKDNKISKEHINNALSSYVSSLNSFNSDFDKMIRKEIELNAEVADGFNLFMGKAKCGTCHFPPTFSGLRPPLYIESETEVIGVTESEDFENPKLDSDLGRRNSGRVRDDFEIYNNSFKTVSVRNVAVSAPYFHNGAFTSLEKVIEFYNKGGGAGLGLDVPNQTLPFDSMNLSDNEQKSILTFLHSLTDFEGFAELPESLPACDGPDLSERIVGGKY